MASAAAAGSCSAAATAVGVVVDFSLGHGAVAELVTLECDIEASNVVL